MSQEDDEDHKSTGPPAQALITGPLSSSLSAISASSRGIPSDKDFHFFRNFPEFNIPVQELASRSQSLLESIATSSESLFKETLRFPGTGDDFDPEEAYDWLVSVNDEILERVDASLDEFERARKEKEKEKEEGEMGRVSGSITEGGFQVVYGKKKKTGKGGLVGPTVNNGSESVSGVKVAENKGFLGSKAKVPFHIATIRRPQEEYSILVNNSNQPFQHVWLEKSLDGSSFVHPMGKLSVSDFVDWSPADAEPVPPPPLESTPFIFVEEVKDLKQMAAKLRGVTEFAIDLEHNQYRSFQGLTCLMQISTRTEDYVVDTLKLKIQIGPHLREVFKDPTKRKVMHGADHDIAWLQRDFGLYICNLFDTGQASRVLKLERNSLEFLLQYFCGVTANKVYQNADWRLRPLPEEMMKYAREDTHYLLHIYDKMRVMLLSMPTDDEIESALLEVYKRSSDICMQLYEKELLTENSYLHLHGLQYCGFNAQQLSVVSGLYKWRDAAARAEDESTGYILPNKMLLEIGKQMPVTTSKLRRLLKSKHPYVERHLSLVVSIIRHAVQNASAFEAATEFLKELYLERMSQKKTDDIDEGEIPASDGLSYMELDAANEGNKGGKYGHTNTPRAASSDLGIKQGELRRTPGRDEKGGSFKGHGEDGNYEDTLRNQDSSNFSDKSSLGKGAGATVQVLKKPMGAFGALLGSSATKRKVGMDKQEKEENKLEKIRSSVNLPFQSFLGVNGVPKALVQQPPVAQPLARSVEPVALQTAVPKGEDNVNLDDDSDVEPREDNAKAMNASGESKSEGLEDIIVLEDDSDFEQENGDSETTNARGDANTVGPAPEMDVEDESVSLSDLSTGLQKCFQSNYQKRKTSDHNKSQEQSSGSLQLKPFNYAAAIRFWENRENEKKASAGDKRGGSGDESTGRRNSDSRGQKDDGTREFPPARRRQAFPVTGNRSATFR